MCLACAVDEGGLCIPECAQQDGSGLPGQSPAPELTSILFFGTKLGSVIVLLCICKFSRMAGLQLYNGVCTGYASPPSQGTQRKCRLLSYLRIGRRPAKLLDAHTSMIHQPHAQRATGICCGTLLGFSVRQLPCASSLQTRAWEARCLSLRTCMSACACCVCLAPVVVQVISTSCNLDADWLHGDCAGPMVRLPDSHIYALWPY